MLTVGRCPCGEVGALIDGRCWVCWDRWCADLRREFTAALAAGVRGEGDRLAARLARIDRALGSFGPAAGGEDPPA